MADTFTNRYGLILPDPDGSLKTGDDSIRALSQKIDPDAGQSLLTPFTSGAIADRPTSTPAQPSGKAGRVYHATDLGLSFRDTGTGWAPEGIAFGVPLFWPGTGGDMSYELLRADGRTIDASTAPAFFTAFAHRFNGGTSPGPGLVRIPNLLGRVLVGADPDGLVIPNSSRTVGQTGGEERHTLSTSEMPGHVHTAEGGNYFVSGPGTPGGNANVEVHLGGGGYYTARYATNEVGGDSQHNNMQPYIALTPIVRVR